MSWQAHKDEFTVTVGRVRSALHEMRAETQRTAAEHERMAAWYAKRDASAARMERRTAASQRQLLADLAAAFQSLERTVSAARLSDKEPNQLRASMPS